MFAPTSWRSKLTNLHTGKHRFPQPGHCRKRRGFANRGHKQEPQFRITDPNSGDFKQFVFRVGEETLY